MRVDAHVASSSRQALMLAIRNVLVAIGINVLLRKTKVYYEYCVPLGAGRSANEKVLRLYITVNEQLGMDEFHTLNLQHRQPDLISICYTYYESKNKTLN